MKKLKKVIILFLLVIGLSGCKVNGEVEVKEDGKVIESITIISDIKKENTKEELLDYINAEINNYSDLIRYGNYKYDIIQNKNNVEVKFFKTHDSICLYFQNTIFNQYEYQHINCSDDGNYIIVENDTPLIKKCADCLDDFDLLDVNFTLKLPKEAEAYENNADVKKENIYIWKFNKDTPENKNFKFKISKRDLETAKENYEIEQKHHKKMYLIKIIIAILIIVSLLIFVVYFLYHKYKINKLEY